MMLILLILSIFVIGTMLILLKRRKNLTIETHSPPKKRYTYQLQKNHSAFDLEERIKNVELLMNDRNFFAAETMLKKALKKHKTSTELYTLLSEIYLLKKDEFSMNILLNQLKNLELNEALSKIKERIKEKNTQSIKNIDCIPQQITEDLNQTHTHPVQHTDYTNTLEFIKIKYPTSLPIQPDIISLNFQLAQRYIKLGHYDEAKKIIHEQEKNYNQEQQNLANQLLKQIVY